jgi:hypothetical protein
MAKQTRFIPNPNKISDTEQNFISQKIRDQDFTTDKNIKDKYKGRMISMSDSFYNKLSDYLKNHSTEGNRSSFIVRVVAEYIDKKKV